MNVKRIATLSGGAAVLAAMIAGATTSGVRRAAPPIAVPDTTRIEAQGAALAAEVARLRERLRPTGEPQEPARNLFQFRARAGRAADVPPPPEPIAAPLVAAAPAPPPFNLVGFATDATPDGELRTAIVSSLGEIFLVKEGDRLGPGHRVVGIGADRVEIESADGVVVTLRLQP